MAMHWDNTSTLYISKNPVYCECIKLMKLSQTPKEPQNNVYCQYNSTVYRQYIGNAEYCT